MKSIIIAMILLVGCSPEETKKPETSPGPTVETCKTLDSERYSRQFSELVCSLKKSEQNPKLKSIILAQWILESGRGNSNLAKNHYNFGGLKWRDEMKPFGSPVEYTAHDGRTPYIKFDSPDNFIKGYWAFIGRSVYKGWDRYSENPHAYIEFINRAGYTPPLSYYKKVIALESEAIDLLK